MKLNVAWKPDEQMLGRRALDLALLKFAADLPMESFEMDLVRFGVHEAHKSGLLYKRRPPCWELAKPPPPLGASGTKPRQLRLLPPPPAPPTGETPMAKMKMVRATGTRMLSEHMEPLPVPLTDAELLARATNLVRLRDEERQAEAEFDKHKQRHKETTARIAEERERLEQAIREKREKREVRVEAWAHYDSGKFQEVRSDTHEVLNERALTALERQQEMEL